MKNDLLVKATWVIKDTTNEIYFDYFNKEGFYIGNIIVSEQGNLEWHIINASYEEDIFSVIQAINGKEIKRMLDYQENDLDYRRFDRAKIFIKNNNIVLNQKFFTHSIDEFEKGNIR